MEVHYIEWHIVPVPARPLPRDLDARRSTGRSPTAPRRAFLTRNEDDTLHLRQVTVWESRADHERWWFSDELSALRQEALKYYHKPVDQHWHAQVADARASQAVQRPARLDGGSSRQATSSQAARRAARRANDSPPTSTRIRDISPRSPASARPSARVAAQTRRSGRRRVGRRGRRGRRAASAARGRAAG